MVEYASTQDVYPSTPGRWKVLGVLRLTEIKTGHSRIPEEGKPNLSDWRRPLKKGGGVGKRFKLVTRDWMEKLERNRNFCKEKEEFGNSIKTESN